ncbi:hypothetical protein NP233_g7792 [Leucocoprinus birnbaumii]|uniref:Uncharacterized protein n=1 Tax=Leucocoprinus birnbaumii TaxID=56174 RepID=A0AAD5YUE3_9AGAR|nr:hypothetical protein NP233_g7792 [Leucocoprinus birnbaumii]
MSWICGILPTFFSFISSFFSRVFSSSHSETSPVVTVDLELGVVGPGPKSVTKSASFDKRPVHSLKVPETDSPRTSIYVPSTLPTKIEPRRTVEEHPPLGPLVHNTFDISTALDRASSPSSESVSDDDASSLNHSLDSSATSSGHRGISAPKSDVSHTERQQVRNGFYENCGATRSTQFDSVEVAEDGVGEEEQWEGHSEVFVDDDLAETVFEAEPVSDDSLYEDDPDIPSHRWLKVAIEFVWLHKLPNTINEMDEDDMIGEVRAVKEAQEVDPVDQFEMRAPVPELFQHAPTPPPPEPGQEVVVETSLYRVKEVTEDLVDLLASLKVAFPDSPSSLCTTFTCNKSDNHHDNRTASPNYDLLCPRPSHELYPEACQWLRPGTSASEVNLVYTADDSSVVGLTGCKNVSKYGRPLSAGRFSPF